MEPKTTKKPSRKLVVFKRELPFYLMLIPGVTFLIIFSYLPMFGLVMAFQDFTPLRSFKNSPWVGLKNFRDMLALPTFWHVVGNTLSISIAKIILRLLVPLILALLLNEVVHHKFMRMAQTVFFLPYFLSWAVMGGVLRNLFQYDGMVNELLGRIGIDPIMFLGSNTWFPIIIILSDVWKDMGYNMIIFLAAITGVDPALNESAALDGANRWQQIWHITLPTIRPIVVMLLVLSLGSVLSAGMEQIMLLYNPMVYKSSDIIDTLVYRLGLVNHQWSLSTAVGMMKSVVSFILVVISYRIASKHFDYQVKEHSVMNRKKMTLFNYVNGVFLLLLVIVCILPILHVIALSLSERIEAVAGNVTFYPIGFTLEAYRYVMEDSQFWTSLRVTLTRVLIGVPANILLVVMTAYPLSKANSRFHARTFFSWLFVITMLFGGGTIPTYIVISKLGLMNTIWALTLPGAMNVSYMILIMNFFRGIPTEIEDAAVIDGANQLQILFRVYLPMSMPSLATIILFATVANWNCWMDGYMYMNTPDKYPLQTYLATILMESKNNVETLMTPEQLIRMAKVSEKTIEAAQIFLAALPIMCVYPFLQKYYTKGIVVGSVKG